MPPASRRLLFPGFCLGLGKGPRSLSLPRDTHADGVLPAWDAERETGGESCLCPLPQGLGTSHEPSWCPLVASSRCPPCLSHLSTFCPSLGAPHGTGLGPSCPHCVPSWHPATSTPCRLCAWPVPAAHALPVDTPRCQFTPTTPGTFQAESPAASPSLGPYRSSSKNFVGFTVTSGPQEPIIWLFIYIPKATLIIPWGGITSGNCFLGQNVDGKKSYEQSSNPEGTEETREPASSLSLTVTRNTLMNSKQRSSAPLTFTPNACELCCIPKCCSCCQPWYSTMLRGNLAISFSFQQPGLGEPLHALNPHLAPHRSTPGCHSTAKEDGILSSSFSSKLKPRGSGKNTQGRGITKSYKVPQKQH
ncbi:uncharacterized protein LOC111936991 isoform X2 [Cyanistes caeruleus]|uniref:uncharacterized protein LOC111936991 isoform X2 n=1 Tax=Cyanistes caeruleus TaxID=156563 RepID=UPI000CDAC1F9|nr:uncharacterized protein LOC111936991 isoform X2 [Cyanistes caeruleus]